LVYFSFFIVYYRIIRAVDGGGKGGVIDRFISNFNTEATNVNGVWPKSLKTKDKTVEKKSMFWRKGNVFISP
jgi:polyphosphate kinase 2 (PPK2 family)